LSYARAKVEGEVPDDVYVVTNGKWHKLYSSLASARGVKTRELKYGYPRGQEVWIVKLNTADGEVVE
jgi:hypothetical protein